MPFWTDRYMADCHHLSDDEHGRYLLVLVTLWRSPRQRIPNDLDWLAHCFRRSKQDIEKQIIPVLREFCQCDGNWWRQGGLTREFSYLIKQRHRQSVRSKSRWDKEKQSSHGNAAPHQSGIAPTPTPTPIVNGHDTKAVVTAVLKSSKMNGGGRKWTEAEKLAWAIEKAIPFLPGADDQQRRAVAAAAEDVKHPLHKKSVYAMLTATQQAKVGWVSPERRPKG